MIIVAVMIEATKKKRRIEIAVRIQNARGGGRGQYL
jgi:hypothetical protein